jgi:hypothetical protein
MPARVKAKFIPPMLLLKTDTLPPGSAWAYQLKLDGYRAIAFKSGGKVRLRSAVALSVDEEISTSLLGLLYLRFVAPSSL